ncbi:hypothetical protein GDO81_007878 [Engystomops pustulosus]|uniref:Uncharacterized protein n=1 Tax=Engystomops pustulosus TaxID=76066 RepID=A0AAV7CAB3_ENGPU|nr:hypothetical protein GDO81_007878 [Engystomops pustulosus]
MCERAVHGTGRGGGTAAGTAVTALCRGRVNKEGVHGLQQRIWRERRRSPGSRVSFSGALV